MQPDCIATGRIWHRRRLPRAHAFGYRMRLCLLDVDTVEARFARSPLWSVQRPNLVIFRRSDYLAPHDRPLGDAVRGRVEKTLGFRPDGRVRMLAHMRQWGMCFNPVTFYFCHAAGGALQAIVADVHNTPWNERHAYVLDARGQTGPGYRFGFDKAFHVSPFLPMDMRYEWRFFCTPECIDIHMRVMRADSEYFSSGMCLGLQEMSAARMTRMPLVFPLMTFRVVAGIYYQAFRLWLKRIPFFTHPKGTSAPTKRENRSI
ncbi:MAG: DUF1365 domain-containing protein [Wenzhouxiangellaceae bacterium]|nr:DUF1365 domain-containing protein [Wenzhouxiangellaceae bacterium]